VHLIKLIPNHRPTPSTPPQIPLLEPVFAPYHHRFAIQGRGEEEAVTLSLSFLFLFVTVTVTVTVVFRPRFPSAAVSLPTSDTAVVGVVNVVVLLVISVVVVGRRRRRR